MDTKVETPESIKTYENEYKTDAWKDYTIEELNWWVYLLLRRAMMRTDLKKKLKDLTDAKNYLDMMRSCVAYMEQNNKPFDGEEKDCVQES